MKIMKAIIAVVVNCGLLIVTMILAKMNPIWEKLCDYVYAKEETYDWLYNLAMILKEAGIFMLDWGIPEDAFDNVK